MIDREDEIRWLATHEEHGRVQFRIGRSASDVVAEWIGVARLIADRSGKQARFAFEENVDERTRIKIERGSGMLLLRHLRGELALHASAVEIGGRALVFLGRSGAGKSTAVAACCTYFGGALLADDACAIERHVDANGASSYVVHPTERDHWLVGECRRELGDARDAPEKVPFPAAKSANSPTPLAAFVTLEFADGEATLVTTSPLESLAALVPSLARFIVDEEETQRTEVDHVIALANEVRVVTLRRPRDARALEASHRPLLTLLAIACCVVLFACGTRDSPSATPSDAGVAIDSNAGKQGVSAIDVSNLIAPALPRVGVPAVGAAVVRSGVLVANGAAGIRKFEDPTPVTLDDKWQLGADVQAMTATLAALLVEDGAIAWSATVGQILSAIPMDVSYTDVRLDWLLEERGGAPTMLPDSVNEAMHATGDPRILRKNAVAALIANPTEVAPGADFHASSPGFLIAALMLEEVANDSWEDLIATRIFTPLGMTSCAFFGPEVGSAVTVPWGHYEGRDEEFPIVPVAPASFYEPAEADGPAGAIRCTLADWAKFCALHLAGARGESTPIVTPASFSKLQTPFDISHALGWNAVSRSWAGDDLALTYETSDASFYAIVWIAPSDDLSIVAVSNVGDRDGNLAANDAVGRLIAQFASPN